MITASCGCKIPESRYNINHEWDGTNRDYTPCICYGSLCTNCEEFYKEEGILRKVSKYTNTGEITIWERK